MDPEGMRLDGNAAGGMLMEIFGHDMTDYMSICGHCHDRNPIGRLLLYTHGMGSVMRCPSCGSVQMRVAEVGGAYAMDMPGVLRITHL